MDEDRAAANRHKAPVVHSRLMALVCVCMFIVLILTLPRLGRAPVVRTWVWEGGDVAMDLLSILGMLGGVFAAVYLPIRFQRILRLPSTVKVLGLVGAGGLIVHLAFALLNLLLVFLAT
ncbi:MAG: hypothetical protein ACP5HU_02260 [Phycisphaerae bacterium]